MPKTITQDGKIYTFTPGTDGSLTATQNNPVKISSGYKVKMKAKISPSSKKYREALVRALAKNK